MSSTDLQVHCHDFAGGRPALAFSIEHIQRAIDAFGKALAGRFPDKPNPVMRDVRLPVYDLAYSVFLKELNLSIRDGSPQLWIKLLATVHPYENPSRVIATYEITIDKPFEVFLSYSETTRKLRWASQAIPLATVRPEFTENAEDILRKLNVPKPVLDNYERKVEAVILWTSSSSAVQLVVNALPPIDLGEMVPWLTLLDPLELNYGGRYLIISSEKVRMTIGACSPVDIIVEPDPKFPYQAADPIETKKSRSVAAVYLPKSRLVELVSRNVIPAVMYDTGERGGIIKWRMNGAFGLKEFTVDVAGGILVGNPWSGDFKLSGTLSASTAVNLSGVARAWIDGPCGVRVGLASASVQGDGRFGAAIEITYHSPGGVGTSDYGATLEARLVVTRSELDPNIDIDAVGWPIDDIIGELVDHLVKKEIHKLSGVVRKLGKWDMVSVPSWLVDVVEDRARLGPVIESLSGVSSVIGITEDEG
ncbi:MAG: hypothetical protein OXQ89_02975 [Rhodospirillaceae bacterium]|nr:hypothetical protein [Rhodospirillaceae bacterium]